VEVVDLGVLKSITQLVEADWDASILKVEDVNVLTLSMNPIYQALIMVDETPKIQDTLLEATMKTVNVIGWFQTLYAKFL
jgi:hypothetical protein